MKSKDISVTIEIFFFSKNHQVKAEEPLMLERH